MFRKTGLLAALCFLLAMTGSAVADGLSQPELRVSPTVADSAKDDGDEGKKEKKRMKPRPYAEHLKKKLQKPSGDSPEPKYKPWNKVVTKEHQKSEGLITIWTKQEEVLIEIGEDAFDKPMLAILSLSQGIGAYFVFGGLPVDDVMFDFHRDKDHVQLRRLTTNFRAPNDPALENTLDLTFSESILENFPIKTEKDGKVIIDVGEFFLSDVSGLGIWMGLALNQPVRLESKKGYFASIKNFPTNTEIDTRLTYSPGRVETLSLPSVPDPRSIQVGVAWSIRKLPEEPMMPRIADDRVGYFTTSFKDFTREKEETFFTHCANIWRLEKKDPTAALSEPKQPIVYYLDHTIPKEYVPYLKEGVEWWQKAFEQAGFKNAIIAKEAPSPEEDPNYDPEDARYNTIRWNTSDKPLYGAIGPSRVDPRTGEIIDSDILFEHSMVANMGKSWRRLSAPRTALMEVDPNLKQLWMTEEEKASEASLLALPYFKNRPYMLCAMPDCVAFGGQMIHLAMLANGEIDAGGEVSPEYVGAALRLIAAHEIGHALGLRHNFKSSGATPYDLLNDKSAIEQMGMTASVMDYATPNIAVNSTQQGYYYSPGIGTYDAWAIRWGYTPVEGATPGERGKKLEPIAAECTQKANLYGTDEDTYTWGAMDPRSNTNDLSDDPMRWALDRMAVCGELLNGGKLEDRVVSEGSDYVPLRSAVQTLLVQKYICANVATKNIGGIYTERAHRGGEKPPFAPVSAAEQRAALDFIVNKALKSENYALAPELLNKLQDDKMWSWENNMFAQGRRFDFPLTDWVGWIQTGVLENLMNPILQARVLENEYKLSEPFMLSELYGTLTRTIWTGNATPSGKTAAWDRNLQRIYADLLIRQVVTPYQATPQDAVALSRLSLQRIRGAAQSALARPGLDDATNAHLMETVARIDRALTANRVAEF